MREQGAIFGIQEKSRPKARKEEKTILGVDEKAWLVWPFFY